MKILINNLTKAFKEIVNLICGDNDVRKTTFNNYSTCYYHFNTTLFTNFISSKKEIIRLIRE